MVVRTIPDHEREAELNRIDAIREREFAMEVAAILREMMDFPQDILPMGASYNTVYDGEFCVRYRLMNLYFQKVNSKLAGLSTIVYGNGRTEEFGLLSIDCNPLFLLNSTEQHRLVETLKKF